VSDMCDRSPPWLRPCPSVAAIKARDQSHRGVVWRLAALVALRQRPVHMAVGWAGY